MNGLIGNTQSAKFIFIACDDENLVPTKSEMSNYFPNHQMNVYKSWGHFSDSFDAIQNYIKIKQTGIESHLSYGHNSRRLITHALRMNPELKRNAFFDLKYAGIYVDSLHLSHEALDKLSSLLKDVGDMNRAIQDVQNCHKHLLQSKDIATKLMLKDTKILSPNQNAIDDLFGGYGDEARGKLMERLEEWRQSVLWI
jgi:hypothetical protein